MSDRIFDCGNCKGKILYREELRDHWDGQDTCVCPIGSEKPVTVIDRLAEVGAKFIALEKDIGRSVVYTAYEGAPAEDGTITGVNDIFVFVRYKGDNASKATRPQDLRWLSA